MITAVAMMGGLGLLVGIGLAAASKIFYVYVDPRVEAVEGVLPGANCGGCGLPGCGANAEAVVAGTASPTSCVAGGSDIAFAIAEILGVAVEEKEPDIARPGCTYSIEDAELKYIYTGLGDCRAAALLNGGMKVCAIGCLGLGTCARACPFDAITMGADGLPVVSAKKCTGCGTCERVCPKHIITLSSVTRRILREYTTDDCTTPCQRTCPAGIDIREYVNQISIGNDRAALQVIMERNPFPATIGRICPRPCETDCRRKYVDEPVAINALKCFAADSERLKDRRELPYKAPATGKRIAVVGGGVSGLSTAFFSARLGHEVTLYEATARLGGLLRSAIPPERLPAEVLDWDIDGILQMGVSSETGKSLGNDFSIEELLRSGNKAVYLAAGGWDSRLTRTSEYGKENPVPGTCLLLDFLKSPESIRKKISESGHVVFFGGGELAVKAAVQCKTLGAKNVTIILREQAGTVGWREETTKVLADSNIKVLYAKAVRRLFGENSDLREIETVDLESLERKNLTATALVLAAGRFPELIFKPVEAEPAPDEEPEPEELTEDGPLLWEAIEPYKKPVYSDETGLFAQGDAFNDHIAAIRAIGAARRAAASIHQLIYGIQPAAPSNAVVPASTLQRIHSLDRTVTPASRQVRMLEAGQTPRSGADSPVCLSERQARIEAERCLQCGLICYEHQENRGAQKIVATAN